VTDDRWKRLLPLLRQQESIAQGEMLQLYYDYVFATLLQLARWQNSKAGAPIPDPELRDLVHELTGEAFVSAFGRIDAYDPDKATLPTWIVWRGKALMNGVVGSAITHAVRDKGYVHLDDELQWVSYVDQLNAGPEWVAGSPEDEVIRRESGAPVRAILRDMPPDYARALIEVYIRTPPIKGAIGIVARDMGRSSSAMDSLLRRAVKDFIRRLKGGAAGSDEAGV
jgi:DNA-directed RNA polymerase specialized sigma24 family protein